ncbi:MAG TPA: DUF1990 domain-containing protein [Jiangellaceae bacterium]|nr:DUF1990 domain-containing protein [Jiangellaceae bacterium]
MAAPDPAKLSVHLLTYAEVGAAARATAIPVVGDTVVRSSELGVGEDLPPGYRHVRRNAVVGRGAEAFAAAGEALLSWEMHRRAGLRVAATAPRAEAGVDVVCWLGAGPFRVTIPCRVVAALASERSAGFAYGTLPGHPARGEEAFLVQWRDDDLVAFTVVAFSRPARLYTRLGGPVTHAIQRAFTRRYFRALRSTTGS